MHMVQNRVGQVIPSEAEIQKLLGMIRTVEKELSKVTLELMPDERQRTLKPRKGGADAAETLAQVAEDKNASTPGVSIEAMRRDFTLARRLRLVAEALAKVGRRVDDTILVAEGEGWHAATAIYANLQRADDAEIQNAIQPVVELFAKKKARSQQAPPGPEKPVA
jgi:hypothetical protein